jgi:Fe-S-cluster containining protein
VVDRPEPPKPAWYEAGLRFSCQRCGQCCSGAPGAVWLAEGDIAALAAALGIDPEQFSRTYARRQGARWRLYEWPHGDCVFYEPASRSCRVYPARPAQCRCWPFWPGNVRSADRWQRTAASCPGCGRGELFDADRIARLSRQPA